MMRHERGLVWAGRGWCYLSAIVWARERVDRASRPMRTASSSKRRVAEHGIISGVMTPPVNKQTKRLNRYG